MGLPLRSSSGSVLDTHPSCITHPSCDTHVSTSELLVSSTGVAGGEPAVTVESDAELPCVLCLNLKESLRLGGSGGVSAQDPCGECVCCAECVCVTYSRVSGRLKTSASNIDLRFLGTLKIDRGGMLSAVVMATGMLSDVVMATGMILGQVPPVGLWCCCALSAGDAGWKVSERLGCRQIWWYGSGWYRSLRTLLLLLVLVLMLLGFLLGRGGGSVFELLSPSRWISEML